MKEYIWLSYKDIIEDKMEAKNLKRITDRFYLNLDKKLGKGCFGEVYEGEDK